VTIAGALSLRSIVVSHRDDTVPQAVKHKYLRHIQLHSGANKSFVRASRSANEYMLWYEITEGR